MDETSWVLLPFAKRIVSALYQQPVPSASAGHLASRVRRCDTLLGHGEAGVHSVPRETIGARPIQSSALAHRRARFRGESNSVWREPRQQPWIPGVACARRLDGLAPQLRRFVAI